MAHKTSLARVHANSRLPRSGRVESESDRVGRREGRKEIIDDGGKNVPIGERGGEEEQKRETLDVSTVG